MALDYVLTKYSQIFRGFTNTTIPAGSLLYATKICLNHFWFRTGLAATGYGNIPPPYNSTATTNALYPSTLMYVGDSFRYWRGDLRFRFTFSKTVFHSGHVIVGFVPFTEYAGTTGLTNTVQIPEVTGFDVQPSSYTATFDLRAGTTFEFVVPFICDTPYCGNLDSIGTLSMMVFNPLLASSAEISTTVNYLVEVAAEPGFELAAVVPSNMARVNTNTGLAVLQSGTTPLVTSGTERQPVVAPSATIIGEHIKSLKQLAMIPYVVVKSSPADTITDVTGLFWFFSPRWTLTTPMSTNASLRFAYSNSGKVASMYAFCNGSTRLTAIPAGGASDVMVNTYYKGNNANLRTANYSGFGNIRNKREVMNPSPFLYSTNMEAVDYPLYSKVQRLPHSYFNSTITPRNFDFGSTTTCSDVFAAAMPCVSVDNRSTTTNINSWFAYSAGEDATASCFIGPPPIVLFNALANFSPNADFSFIEQ
jgi:hypothetical protein